MGEKLDEFNILMYSLAIAGRYTAIASLLIDYDRIVRFGI